MIIAAGIFIGLCRSAFQHFCRVASQRTPAILFGGLLDVPRAIVIIFPMTGRRGFTSVILAGMLMNGPASGVEPATFPTIPMLSFADIAGPRAFVIEGVAAISDGPGLAFRLTRDGERTLCVLFDAADGTPIFLSDGKRTLIYDLPGGGIIDVPLANGYVKLVYNRENDRPLKLTFGADLIIPNAAPTTGATTQPKEAGVEPAKEVKKSTNVAGIDLSGFLSRTDDLQRSNDASTQTYSVDAGDHLSTLEMAATQSSFRFFDVDKTTGRFSVLVKATCIDSDIPDDLLRFSTLEELAEDVTVYTLPGDSLLGFAKLLANGTAFLPKLALARGTDFQKNAAKGFAHSDWETLRKKDAALASTYHAALEKQGTIFAAIQCRRPDLRVNE